MTLEILAFFAFSLATLFIVTAIVPNGRVSSIPPAPLRLLVLLITLPSVLVLILIFCLMDFVQAFLLDGWEAAKRSLSDSKAEISDFPRAVIDCIRGEAWVR